MVKQASTLSSTKLNQSKSKTLSLTDRNISLGATRLINLSNLQVPQINPAGRFRQPEELADHYDNNFFKASNRN